MFCTEHELDQIEMQGKKEESVNSMNSQKKKNYSLGINQVKFKLKLNSSRNRTDDAPAARCWFTFYIRWNCVELWTRRTYGETIRFHFFFFFLFNFLSLFTFIGMSISVNHNQNQYLTISFREFDACISYTTKRRMTYIYWRTWYARRQREKAINSNDFERSRRY